LASRRAGQTGLHDARGGGRHTCHPRLHHQCLVSCLRVDQVSHASRIWWTATQTVFGATPSRPALGSVVALAACPAPSDGFSAAGSPHWSVSEYLRFPDAP
jgi:hypothetical protein